MVEHLQVTGLRLGIVKQIMIRRAGEVGYQAAPGGGTIFHVDVPRWHMGAAPIVEPAETVPS